MVGKNSYILPKKGLFLNRFTFLEDEVSRKAKGVFSPWRKMLPSCFVDYASQFA